MVGTGVDGADADGAGVDGAGVLAVFRVSAMLAGVPFLAADVSFFFFDLWLVTVVLVVDGAAALVAVDDDNVDGFGKAP